MAQGEIEKMLAETNKEMENSKRILQELANEVAQLTDIVQPALEKQIAALRSARMATVGEIKESLVALREIRTFFLEDRHAQEVASLKEFVEVMERLRDLKSAGVLDAVADTIIRLGVGEMTPAPAVKVPEA